MTEHSASDIAEQILQLGKAGKYGKTGSFGEQVFAHIAAAKGHRVELMHSKRIDFLVDGIPVDVKTPPTRMGEKLLPPAPWVGTRYEGVTYSQVEVAREAIRITWDSYFTEIVDWASVQEPAERWASKQRWNLPSAEERLANSRAWDAVTGGLEAFFAERDIRCRAIHRTIQVGFGDESPGNLVLKRFKENDLRVFVSYDRFVREDAMEYVIAFPCKMGLSLPMRPKERNKLHIEKVDLKQLPARYRFGSLEELRAEYGRAL